MDDGRGGLLLRKKSKYPAAEIALSEVFGKYLTQWRLVPDGDPIITPGSRLLPVRKAKRQPCSR
jgi:hypothetical protein